MNYFSIKGERFLVSDYGAYPNDNFDDTNGIQLAINQAINHGLNSEIIFGFGIYNISSTILIHYANNLTVAGQGMDKTFLIGCNPIEIFSVYQCQGLKITLFSIDYNPLPFTAGYVVDVNKTYLDIEVVPPHQANIGQEVMGIYRYDPIQMRPAFGPNHYNFLQSLPTYANTSLVSPGILRIPLSSPTRFLKGDPVVARYRLTSHVIFGADSVDITIQSIIIYTSWAMGVTTTRIRRLNIIDYHVLPYGGRWTSTILDCMHFTDTREYVSISDSICHTTGDDGLNVHANYLLVTEIINSTTIIINATNSTMTLDVGVGTTLEFSSSQQPFTVYGNASVASLVFDSTHSRQITFTSPVNVNLGDWVCVADTPMLIIRNFTVVNNMGRGVLLETRNIDIRNSLFNRTSGPAILIQPSMYWDEGPEARNVSLINNIYIENNEGVAQEEGIITVLPYPIQLVPVINDIRIESSTFYLGTYSQGLVQSDNANNIFISGNYIATNSSSPLISICNSRNISAENNCVVNTQTKIDQYYTFDQTNPCSMNLSSLIDLPPSAFNSSFPPPVIRKDLS